MDFQVWQYYLEVTGIKGFVTEALVFLGFSEQFQFEVMTTAVNFKILS